MIPYRRSLAEVAAALTRLGVSVDDEPLLLRSLAQCGISCRGRWLRSSVDPSTDACRSDVLELFDAKRVVSSICCRLRSLALRLFLFHFLSLFLFPLPFPVSTSYSYSSSSYSFTFCSYASFS